MRSFYIISPFSNHLAFYFLLLTFNFSCTPSQLEMIWLQGEAQGTTYQIKYIDFRNRDLQNGVDSLLRMIDISMSLYIPNSIISLINAGDSTARTDNHFENVLRKALEVAGKTGGAFDPTIAPLVKAWGFGPDKILHDSMNIECLRKLVNYRAVKIYNHKIFFDLPEATECGRMMIDLNGLAQGYTVDVIALLLESRGITNYMVELGGEVKAKGTKSNREEWKIGVDKPLENAENRVIQATISLTDKALATSGSYRNFYEKEGKKYSHEIDPFTGYPVSHSLLSVSVLADDCMTADAFATAFMVMGMEKAIVFMNQNPNLGLEAYFIYDRQEKCRTYTTQGLKEILKE